jgi:uracil-DNA glycosylase
MGVRHWSFINATDCDVASTDNVDWAVLELARPYQRVLALGNFASAALDRLSIAHFQLPHPSPLNRKLNDPSYEKTVLRECYNYLHED